MALLYPINGGYESQPFGPTNRLEQPAMYGDWDRAFWQPYAGLPYRAHLHNGLDIAAANGTPIYACERGIVRYAGWKTNGGGYVLSVEIRPGTRYEFAHLSSLGVSVGQMVSRGQMVARVGATGTATGPHTHFSVLIVERDLQGISREVHYNPKHFLPSGKWGGDIRILPPSPTPAPPPPSAPTITAAGLPMSFTNRTGWRASIAAGKPRRAGASLTATNYGNTSRQEAFPIWGEVAGQDLTLYGLAGGTRWFFGAQYVGSWRVVYIPYADLVGLTFS